MIQVIVSGIPVYAPEDTFSLTEEERENAIKFIEKQERAMKNLLREIPEAVSEINPASDSKKVVCSLRADLVSSDNLTIVVDFRTRHQTTEDWKEKAFAQVKKAIEKYYGGATIESVFY